MITVIHPNAKKLILVGTLNLGSDTIKVALMSTFNTTTFESLTFWSDILAGEITPVGTYQAGGMTLATPSVSIDGEVGKLAFDSVSISNLTATFQYLVLYQYTGNNATSPLIGYIDLQSPVTYSVQNIRIVWNTSGVMRLL